MRLFFHIFSMEARKQMSYRADFWVQTVLSIVLRMATMYYVWWSVFHATGSSTVGGYTLPALMFYYMTVNLFAGVVRGEAQEGIISKEIYEGGLTRYLLYPTRFFAFKYAQYAGACLISLMQVALFGAAYILIFGAAGGQDVSVASSIMALCALALANYLYFLLQSSIELVAFWADQVWALLVAHRLVSQTLGGMMFPLAMFSEGMQTVARLLPFNYLFAFPVQTLLGSVGVVDWCVGMLIAALWCVAIRWLQAVVWRRGDVQYTGVGI